MIAWLLFLILVALLWPSAAKFILKAALILFLILLMFSVAQAKYSHTPIVASGSSHFKHSASSNLLNTEARDG
jgi:hypothetical protein